MPGSRRPERIDPRAVEKPGEAGVVARWNMADLFAAGPQLEARSSWVRRRVVFCADKSSPQVKADSKVIVRKGSGLLTPCRAIRSRQPSTSMLAASIRPKRRRCRRGSHRPKSATPPPRPCLWTARCGASMAV